MSTYQPYVPTAVRLAKELEAELRRVLTSARKTEKFSYTVFELYSIAQQFQPGITSGFFNKTLADMRSAGIVGSNKKEHLVWLSDAAWEMYQAQKDSVKAGV